MKDKIEAAFPVCIQKGCLETITQECFEIYDDEAHTKQCRIRKEDSNPVHVTVRNSNQKDIHFLAIDGCLFGSKDDTRCDCAVFDEQTCCWVEIKDTNPRNRSENRKKAISQLKNTIEIFKRQLDMTTYTLEAYMCLGIKKVYPAVRSSNLNAVKEFEDELQTELKEGNQITFS